MGGSLGGRITTESDEAKAAWARAARGVLSIARATPDHVAAALEADPGLVVAHCLTGYGHLGLARNDRLSEAREALARARASLAERGGSPAERALVEGLARWSTGNPAGAADVLGAALRDAPDDLLLMRLDHACRFMIGDATGMRESAARVLDALGDDAPGYALGMASFAMEETGALEAAEELARRALDDAPDDAWAAHSLAHVYEMRDRPGPGRAWLERCHRDGTFAHCNNFAGHVLWHLALFCLAERDVGAALAIHDHELAEPDVDFRDVSNAASLLFRIEELGADVGERWERLAERVRPLAADHGYAFADAHYALVLAAGGRDGEARGMLASLVARAADDPTHAGEIQRRLGLPLVRGILALTEGDAARAYDELSVCRRGVSPVGGSHAQRELFRRLWIHAARRTGRADALARAADAYLSVRPHSAWARALTPPSEEAPCP